MRRPEVRQGADCGGDAAARAARLSRRCPRALIISGQMLLASPANFPRPVGFPPPRRQGRGASFRQCAPGGVHG